MRLNQQGIIQKSNKKHGAHKCTQNHTHKLGYNGKDNGWKQFHVLVGDGFGINQSLFKIMFGFIVLVKQPLGFSGPIPQCHFRGSVIKRGQLAKKESYDKQVQQNDGGTNEMQKGRDAKSSF